MIAGSLLVTNGPPDMPEQALSMPLAFLRKRERPTSGYSSQWSQAWESEWAPVTPNMVSRWNRLGYETVADLVEADVQVTDPGAVSALMALRYGWLPQSYLDYLERVRRVLSDPSLDGPWVPPRPGHAKGATYPGVYDDFAAKLMSKPGQWRLLPEVYPGRDMGQPAIRSRSLAYSIEHGGNKSFPAGQFEAIWIYDAEASQPFVHKYGTISVRYVGRTE